MSSLTPHYCSPQKSVLATQHCADSQQQTLVTRALRQKSWTAPQLRHQITRTSTGSCCSATNGTLRSTPWLVLLSLGWGLCQQNMFVWCGCWWLCRGLLLEEKPELKRVLEQRRLELHKEEEMAQRRPSDLETELRKRQQKLEEVLGTVAVTARHSFYKLNFIIKKCNLTL